MTRHAAAYIRRSSISTDSPGDASREAQLDSIGRLAKAYAPQAALVIHADWGISGRKDDRPEYTRLKADIEAGSVCCVFAYSLSRLGRTASELDRFFKLCAAHDVMVVTQVEGTLGAGSAMSSFLLQVMSSIAELESELAKERSAAARAAKRERGDVFGQPPYGYRNARDDSGRLVHVLDPERRLQPVLDAYRDAGTVLGACRLLRERGVPAPKGGEAWATSALTRILEREAPEMLPRKTARGVRSGRSAIFAGLLECPFCGRVLTPNTHRGQYYCPNGPRERDRHPRYTVREVDVLPRLQAEAALIDIPAEAVTLEGIETRRDAINDRLARAHELYIAGDIDKAKLDAEKARYNRELNDLAGEASAAAIAPDIDWAVDAGLINAALRSMWRRVRLDERLLPTEVEWIVPEWRRAA